MKPILFAGISALLILAPMAAYAEDAALCQALDVIMPYANSGFSAVTGSRINSSTLAVTMALPYAYKCYIYPDKAGNKYVCEYRIDPSRDVQEAMTNFAANIAECRPGLTSHELNQTNYRDIFLENQQAKISLSFMKAYPREFNIYIKGNN